MLGSHLKVQLEGINCFQAYMFLGRFSSLLLLIGPPQFFAMRGLKGVRGKATHNKVTVFPQSEQKKFIKTETTVLLQPNLTSDIPPSLLYLVHYK